MTKKTGLKYEHDIANQIHEATDGSIRTYRCGFSGNSKYEQPDVLVTTPLGNQCLELKKTSQDKGFRIPKEDFEQLIACTNDYTKGYFGVKFARRELLMFQRFGIKGYEDGEVVVQDIPNCFNPRVGEKSGALMLDKPSLDGPNDWPSAQSGRDDCDVILSAIGVEPPGDDSTDSQADMNPFEIPTTEGARA